jgi:hypothetical protein
MPSQVKLLSAPADAALGYAAEPARGPQDEFLMNLVKVHRRHILVLNRDHLRWWPMMELRLLQQLLIWC